MSNVLDEMSGDGWYAIHGDCVDGVRKLPANSIDYSIFSPPFASLYSYSATERDFGNCADYDQFSEHMDFLIPSLFDVIKPGRLVSMHCMLLPTSKTRHGYIGLQDFRGELIRSMQKHGFYFHSEVTIWKDPVAAVTRTKALGLLDKQLRKDSAMSRQGIPDYLCTFRKPGENAERITKGDEFKVERWQRYASPVWVTTREVDDEGFLRCVTPTAADNATDSGGIHPGDTLQFQSAREDKDTKHICPLQLSVIRRAVRLWTNPNDVVLSPFMGIGSEGWVSLQEKRRFVGCELKKSYFDQASRNLAAACRTAKQPDLFSLMQQEAAQ
jgi:DNA modification methylase